MGKTLKPLDWLTTHAVCRTFRVVQFRMFFLEFREFGQIAVKLHVGHNWRGVNVVRAVGVI